MLYTYQKTVQRISRDVTQQVVNLADLTDYINRARRQAALESQCIRVQGTLTLTPLTNNYPFSAITPVVALPGYGGVLNVRQILVALGAGQQWLQPRGFEWFTSFRLNNPAPVPGLPDEWSQFGQGAAGSLYFDPNPDQAYVLTMDTVAYPVALVDDTTPEAIPDFWTDAIPFLTMYLWLLSAQSPGNSDAAAMLQIYQGFMARARAGSTPDVMPNQYPQVPSPADANIFGQAPQRQQAGGG